jgi:opacity protein-like surface antigen
MNMAKALALILVFLTLMAPRALWAGDGNDAYVVLKGGGYFPLSSDLKDQDAKTGFLGELGFGYYLLPFLSLEVAGGYFGTKGDMENTNTERKFSLYPLEVTGKLGLPILFLEPYVEAGVGGYYVKSTAGSQEETSWRGGYFGGAGINFNLGPIILGLEGRYLFLKAPAPAPTSSNPSATTDIKLDGIIGTLNVGFRF